MQDNRYIGKRVNLAKADEIGFDYDREEQTLELYVYHEFLGFDEHGRNAYSVLLVLENETIKEIVRFGHCHMCNAQGSDGELSRFPSEELEADAAAAIEAILCESE